METEPIVDYIPPAVSESRENILLEEVVSTDDPIGPGAPKPDTTIPKLVFIVPYRDRKQQQHFFANHMKMVLSDIPESDYKIYYVEQLDTRGFNRGAMKNIGFLIVRQKYPNDYKNITLVFNDVDTMPFTKNFLNYDTVQNNVKHFYGYTFTLGGIVSIKAGDFERAGGFPNFWAWGFEDNLLQRRVLAANMVIDRSQFYPIMDPNIFQMKDGMTRIVNRGEFDRYMSETIEGFSSIRDLTCEVDETTGFIRVSQFFTAVPENAATNTVHDLRNGGKPFQTAFMQKMGRRRNPRMSMVI
jgi:hypothetical protein